MSQKLKIAIIGAGSVGFTKKLCIDILCVPELQDIEIALTDINQHNLDMVRQIIDRIVEVNRLPTRITATTDRRKALEGARYVMNCVRIGGLEAFADDIRIPLKYGVDQCVGDTICAGGIMYGQRTIPAILDFCQDIREVGEPGAKLLNYANPMAMNTWAAIDHGRVDTIGLCHGVQNGWRQIANALGASHPTEVDFICSGINHQTWYIDIRFRGRKISRDELVAAFERHPVYSQQEKVRIDVLKRFGFYSTESNGHLSEYLPWYRKRPDEIRRWIDMSDWIHGETGGYLRYSTESRNWFETDFPQFLEEAGKPIDVSKRTDEHASHIIEALETGPDLPRPLQRQEPRPHHQPARGCDRRVARLRRPLRPQHGRGHHAAGRLRRDLPCLDQRAAHVRPGRGHRRRRAAQARRAARPAGRRHLLPRGGLADGRRDARRPGAVAAAICPRDPCRQGPASTLEVENARMVRGGSSRYPFRR